MAMALLDTKLYTPRARAAMVERPRLLARLGAGLGADVRLILVCAPAGFGKTSLLATWLAAPDPAPRAAWVSLDLSDNDPARFWSYLLAALDQALPGVGRPALQALQAPQPPPLDTLLTPTINALAAALTEQGPLVLVLDDYHVISEASIHASLTFLINQLPPQVCLVLASRADPPLPLSRWRARGQLVEIRAADLRFTPEEAALFFGAKAQLALATPEVEALTERTEGWVAGLHLAALAMHDRADRRSFVANFAGSHRFVVDYLVEEVVARQPAHIQAFLLQTAILDRMSGPLCDTVLGVSPADDPAAQGRASPFVTQAAPESYSQLILRELDRANLFTLPLDDERHWYRYHHLFADVLRERLRAGASGAVVAELHRRASAWFEGQGLEVEAITHTLAAGDWERAARLIQAWAWPVVFRGQMQTVLGWFATLPAALLRAHPGLIVLHANLLMHTRRLEAAEARLQEAETVLSAGTSEEQALLARVGIPTTRGNICFYRGDLAGCVAYGREALILAADTPQIAHVTAIAFAAHGFLLSGDVTPAVEAQVAAVAPIARAAGHRFVLLRSLTLLAQLHILQGRLRVAAACYHQAEQVAPEPGGVLNLIGSPGYAFGLGDLYREWNDLDGAELLLRAGMERALGGLTINATYLCQGAIALARLQQAGGDPAGARATLEQFAELGRQHAFDSLVLARGQAARAQLDLAQGDREDALRWAASCGLRADDPELPFPREPEYLTLARILIAQGRDLPDGTFLPEANGLLDRLLAAAEAGGRTGSAIEIGILRALALQAGRDTEGAHRAIENALRLAAPEGYARLFLDEGPPLAGLLKAWDAQRSAQLDPLRHYCSQLLAGFVGFREEQPFNELTALHTTLPPQGLIEPLSARELEILRLIAAGHSNQAIADTLVIAVSTVKRHINNIYGKLAVQSRTQALARARELRLL